MLPALEDLLVQWERQACDQMPLVQCGSLTELQQCKQWSITGGMLSFHIGLTEKFCYALPKQKIVYDPNLRVKVCMYLIMRFKTCF